MKSSIISGSHVLFIAVVLMLSSCKTTQGVKKNSPEWVSKHFFELLQQQEYEEAKKYATEKTKRIIGVVQTLSEMGGGVNILKDNKKELSGCTINGDEAVCNYKTFSGPDQQVYLQKIKGKWLVDLRKDAAGMGKDD